MIVDRLHLKNRTIEKLYSKRIIDPNTWCWFQKNGKKDQYHQGPQLKGVRPKLHVWSFTYFVSPVPEGHIVDHKCSNKGCWNPHHLQAVTPSKNTKLSWDRGERRDRSNQHTNKSHCEMGHKFTKENTKINVRGARICVFCDDERKRKFYLRTNSNRMRVPFNLPVPEIMELYVDGKSINEISVIYDVSPQTISRRLIKAGVIKHAS